MSVIGIFFSYTDFGMGHLNPDSRDAQSPAGHGA